MNTGIVLFYEGEVPEYFWKNLFNTYHKTDMRIYLIMNEKYRHTVDIARLSNINFTSIEFLSDYPSVNAFKLHNFLSEGFWTYAAVRLFYIEALMDRLKLDNIIHLESDIVIYENPSIHYNAMRRLFNNKIAVNPLGEDHITLSYIYMDSKQAIERVNNHFIELIKKSQNEVNELTNNNGVNEMTIVNLIAKYYPDLIDFFPILPDSRYIEDFNCVFDPASYGQYLGGTDNGHPKGYAGNHHYIGRKINNKELDIYKLDNHYYVNGVRISSLHIHNKKVIGDFTC